MLFQKKSRKKGDFAASFNSVQLPNTRNALFKFSLRCIIVLNYYTTGNLRAPFHAVSLRLCVAACDILIQSVFQKKKQWINREMHPEQPFSSADCFKYPIISPIFCHFFKMFCSSEQLPMASFLHTVATGRHSRCVFMHTLNCTLIFIALHDSRWGVAVTERSYRHSLVNSRAAVGQMLPHGSRSWFSLLRLTSSCTGNNPLWTFPFQLRMFLKPERGLSRSILESWQQNMWTCHILLTRPKINVEGAIFLCFKKWTRT